MQTLQQFINTYNGKKVDFDKAYGAQCTDIVKYWVQNLGLPITRGNGNQYASNATTHPAHYKWVKNTPAGVPKAGDIVVWGTGIGQFGHVAIFIEGNTRRFTSFDQNFPVGSACHVQEHTYSHVAGWLHMPALDSQTPPPPPPVDPRDTEIADLKDKLAKANVRVSELETRLEAETLRVNDLQSGLNNATAREENLRKLLDATQQKVASLELENSELKATSPNLQRIPLATLLAEVIRRLFKR